MKRQAKLLIILVLSVVLNLVYSFEDDDDPPEAAEAWEFGPIPERNHELWICSNKN